MWIGLKKKKVNNSIVYLFEEFSSFEKVQLTLTGLTNGQGKQVIQSFSDDVDYPDWIICHESEWQKLKQKLERKAQITKGQKMLLSIDFINLNEPEAWNTPGLKYVGYSSKGLGFGNPWFDSLMIKSIPKIDLLRHIKFYVEGGDIALKEYSNWMHKRILHSLIYGMALMQPPLQEWEINYRARTRDLITQIKEKNITVFGDFNLTTQSGYFPVEDGREIHHAEILFKVCVKFLDFKAAREG